MENVKPGDYLFGSDGKPYEVLTTSKIELKPCYRLSFSDGTSIVADADHLWFIYTTDGIPHLYTTEMLWLANKPFFIPIAKPLQLPPQTLSPKPYELDIDDTTFIPSTYLRASIEQRQELLDNLPKTKRGNKFYTASLGLANRIADLMRSLGYHVNIDYVKSKKQYAVTPRQLPFKTIVSVEPTLPALVKCVGIASPDHTYLAGEGYTVTHNTTALMLETTRFLHIPNFYVVVFRNTYKQIMQADGLWDRASYIYPLLGGKPERQHLRWRFPSGARVEFSYLESKSDALKYKGSAFAVIMFDQVEEISEEAFFYMVSRNRSMSGINGYIRAGCNPDPDSWLARFIEWWIDQESGFPIEERSGKLRWFVRVGDEIIWFDNREDALQLARQTNPSLPEDVITTIPRSVTFIPATVYDNQALLQKDPEYLARLLSLPTVEQQRLLHGNWKIRPAAGTFFNRTWFEVVDTVPREGYDCRFWDFASTMPSSKNKDPDETAAVKARYCDGKFYILDVITARGGPAEIEELFLQVTYADAQENERTGIPYMVRWEEEPGSAGKREGYRYVTMLQGIDAAGIPPVHSKEIRAKPLATQAKNGNVKILRADWNERFLTQMHHFGAPDAKTHDDIVDATAGAYNALTVLRAGSFGMF